MTRKARHKITIQAVTQSQDAMGGPVDTYAVYAIRWAEIRPTGGREYFQAQQIASDNKWGFKVRYDSKTKDISSKHQITYDGKVFDIQGEPVNLDDRNKEIIIMALERNG
jgi:SPP1 family predicted phage head-tail adaptor